MVFKLCKVMGVVVFFTVSFLQPLQGEEKKESESDYKTIIKTVDGLKFDVPEDRPIEKKHSIIAPMPLDEYVAMKFLKLEDRLQKIENSIKQIEEDLSLIKEKLSKLNKE
jgi:hypothetical protein